MKNHAERKLDLSDIEVMVSEGRTHFFTAFPVNDYAIGNPLT